MGIIAILVIIFGQRKKMQKSVVMESIIGFSSGVECDHIVRGMDGCPMTDRRQRNITPELRDIPLTFMDCDKKGDKNRRICMLKPMRQLGGDPFYHFCANIRRKNKCLRGFR